MKSQFSKHGRYVRGSGYLPEMSTTEYEWSHAKRPAGRGHWGFWVRPYRGAPDSKSELFWAQGEMLYSEAKAHAICRAYDLWAGLNPAFIEVAP